MFAVDASEMAIFVERLACSLLNQMYILDIIVSFFIRTDFGQLNFASFGKNIQLAGFKSWGSTIACMYKLYQSEMPIEVPTT